MTSRESAVRVGLVYPELLGTYGDRGNAVVLVQRCRWRGIPAELVEVRAGAPIPDSLDVYLFGGGEDDPQLMAAEGMRASRANIERAHAGGAVILAVCAGFQLLGHRYDAADGEVIVGAGIVDLVTRAGTDRLIGEVVVEPTKSWVWGPAGAPATLTGFENHGGRTTLGEGLDPLGTVLAGGGNGAPTADGQSGADGLLSERLVGTYMHGPVLPRNPQLADRLLGWITSPSGDGLPALDSDLEQQLREERVHAGRAKGLRKWVQDRALARG
jgi:lipid II isoglutaminyl synthase (glutamine-hydrolysing)